jgi:hypothetical protein
LQLNKPIVEFSEVEVLGMRLPQKTTLTYLGNEANSNLGKLLFVSEVSNTGDDLSSLVNIINDVNQSASKPALNIDALKGFRFNKKITVDATVELKTLRPLDVNFLTEISASEAGVSPKVKIEKHRYLFEWLK